MTQKSNVDRWYPHFEDHSTHEAFRVAFDRIYELHDKMQQQTASAASAKPVSGATTGDGAGGPSTTKIAGLRVHATPPNNNDRLTYDDATGEIVWKP